jgi:transcriptional regulator with XRE-family HTH domain
MQITACQEGDMMFSEKIRILRQERGMTQSEVAKAIKMSMRGYQDLELGVMPRSDKLLTIADYYNVSIDWLMGRTDKREINR